ncbi:MAG: PD-(D/E)XK nuclease family protein [Burkholderiaceae bacterium]|nr:PD-(D/E)XK nuclease family protein [Burkholderiaceae bacterium]
MLLTILTLAVAAAVLVTAWCSRRARAVGADERTWQPRELARARLVYRERQFRTSAPLKLVARVDRAYRLPTGRLVLMELKRRSSLRIYPSDIVQLSAQKVALEGATGEAVEPYAFVRVVTSERNDLPPRRVALLDASQVTALQRRREAILAGRVAPGYAQSSRACRDCAFRSCCDRPRRPG